VPDFTTQSGTLAGISPLVADSAYNGLTWGLATTSTSIYDQRYGAGIWLSTWGTNGQRFIFKLPATRRTRPRRPVAAERERPPGLW